MTRDKSNLRIGLLSLVLNNLAARRWVNYDEFAEGFVDRILADFAKGELDFTQVFSGLPSSFFKLNHISKKKFLTPILIARIRAILGSDSAAAIDFVRIFPEIRIVKEYEALAVLERTTIPEKEIQDTLRRTLRLKGACPIPIRGKDSALEVADIEHFGITIDGTHITLAVIVKGYDSISSTKLSWKDIAHQVTKAYSATRPDHLLVLTAKEPKDSVITHLTQYSQDVGNPNLIILVPPQDLAKFMKAYRE